MGRVSEYIERYRRRQEMLHPDPLDITYEHAVNSRPRWNQYERRDIILTIRRRNPARFGRLERDMIWLRRQLLEMGLDPEQARWLL